jgi:hypothetical protein
VFGMELAPSKSREAERRKDRDGETDTEAKSNEHTMRIPYPAFGMHVDQSLALTVAGSVNHFAKNERRYPDQLSLCSVVVLIEGFQAQKLHRLGMIAVQVWTQE